MAEENPLEGTSLLSTESAVDILLAQDTPEGDTVDEREEREAQDDEEVVDEPEAEAEEVEVEAEAEDSDSEDIDDDEADEEEETEEVIVEEPSTEPMHRIRVGDEEIDVPLSELTNSYMRQSDYTRKTQQVAEQRKAAEAELANVQAQRKNYADQLEVLEQSLNQGEPTQEYWEQLYTEDPLEYTRQKDLARDRKDALAQVAVEKQRVHEEHLAELQSAAQKDLAVQHERMRELIPEWLNEEVAAKEKNDVVTYAQRQGFTPEELQGVSDARAVAMIRKAYLYDELMSKKPAAAKKTKAAPKMIKTNAPKSKKQSSKRQRQKALASISNKSGRDAMDAAVDFLLTDN